MFKNLFIWIIVVLISSTLVLSSFDFNSKNKSVLDKSSINDYELNTLISLMKIRKSFLYDIDNIDEKLFLLIKDNLRFNSKIRQYNFIITKETFLEKMSTESVFFNKKSFSFDLYKQFLLKNNIQENVFQKNVLNNLVLNKFKNDINLICNLYKFDSNYKLQYKVYFFNNKFELEINHIYYSIFNNYITKLFYFEFINFSIQKLIKNIQLNIKLFKNSYIINKSLYFNKSFVKISFFKISKKIKKYDTFVFNLKNDLNEKEIYLNTTLKKKKIVISFKELNHKFLFFFDRYKSKYFFLELTNFLYIFELNNIDKKIYYLNIFFDIKNKIKKKYTKLLFLIYLNKFDFKFNGMNLFLDVVYTNPFVYNKSFIWLDLITNLKNKNICINKYNYLFFNLLNKMNYENHIIIQPTIKKYLMSIKIDKLSLFKIYFFESSIDNFFINKIYYNNFTFNRFTQKILRYNNKYYFFYLNSKNKNICLYKDLKKSMLAA